MHILLLRSSSLRASFVAIFAFLAFFLEVVSCSCAAGRLWLMFRRTRLFIAEDVNARLLMLSQSSIDDNAFTVSARKLVFGFMIVPNDPSAVRSCMIVALAGAPGLVNMDGVLFF